VELCIQIDAKGDPLVYDRVGSLIEDRYGRGLYRPTTVGERSDVEVRLSRPGQDPIWVRDASRHQALQWRLVAEIGKTRVGFGQLSPEQVQQDLDVVFRYRIVPEAQLALFRKLMDDLPAMLASYFPISVAESPFEISLGMLKFFPPRETAPGGVASSRWSVRAHLTLANRLDGRAVDSGWFWLCNFFGPGDDGRIIEPGRSRGRAFDEIASTFPDSIRAWLGTTIRENLASQSPENMTIRGIFEFED
jgi:hypothetical protein